MQTRFIALVASVAMTLSATAQSNLTIQIRQVGDQIETSWTDPGGILEQADNQNGPWDRVPEAVSPHLFSPNADAKFFRLIRGPGGDVVGSLYTLAQMGPLQTQVYLPGVSAYLVNLSTLAKGPSVTTDANGMFILSGQPPGHYQLCWEASGFVSGCSTQQVTLLDDIVYLPAEAVTLQNNGSNHAMVGEIGFTDRAPLHQHDSFFDIDYGTTVHLETNGIVIASTMPNSSGQFVLTGAPLGGIGQLVATVESLSVQTDIDLALADAGSVVFSNSRPVIMRAFATLNSHEVKRAAPGDSVTLTVEAEDLDGDTLHYYWVPSLSQGSFVSSDSTNVTWTLPIATGIHVMYVRVSDSRGGYATARIRVSTAPELLFSGVVLDSDGLPVSDATVSLGSTETLTDTSGAFSLMTTNNSPPFVVTLTKPGFAPISRVFDDESAGGSYTFIKPETFSRQADEDIFVKDSKGLEVFIPSNSLTRLDGLPLVNPVTVAVTTIDPCNPLVESPVSTVAAGSGTPDSFLSSMSTAHVRLQDASGTELLLQPGSAATLALPISPACYTNYPNLPNSVGVWSYELATGKWYQSGNAVLRPSPIGGTPVYQLGAVAVLFNNHNAVDPTGPYSIINLAADRSIALPFDVRVVGPSIAYTRTVFVSPTPFVFPPSTAISFSLLDHRQAPGGHFNDLITPTATATADTSKTINLTVNTVSPAPYITATVTMKLGSLLPALLTKVEQAEPFLTHNYLTGNATTAANYYAAIDPANQKTTLAAWKIANGFNTGDEAAAVYFNAGDLGFGRSMHMKRKTGADSNTDTAFYVSNHDTVDHARTGFGVIATVAMDYAYNPTYPSHGRYTKFYVFDASGNRVDRANLDNNGDKFVPNLCMICHGGNHGVTGTASTGWNLNAKFIPFDMESYTYSTLAAFKPGAQHNAFRTMNLAIRNNTAPTAAIQALIDGWYGISGTGNFNKNFVPTAWQGGSDLPVYRDVIKPSCRACHTTRGLDFTTPSSASFCGNNVCNILVMPDAQRTFSILWGSKTANVGVTGTPPNQPTMLNVRYGANYGTIPCP